MNFLKAFWIPIVALAIYLTCMALFYEVPKPRPYRTDDAAHAETTSADRGEYIDGMGYANEEAARHGYQHVAWAVTNRYELAEMANEFLKDDVLTWREVDTVLKEDDRLAIRKSKRTIKDEFQAIQTPTCPKKDIRMRPTPYTDKPPLLPERIGGCPGSGCPLPRAPRQTVVEQKTPVEKEE